MASIAVFFVQICEKPGVGDEKWRSLGKRISCRQPLVELLFGLAGCVYVEVPPLNDSDPLIPE